MKNELRRFPDLETGGVLLGYSNCKNGIQIFEATDGGYQNAIRTQHTFQYDTAYVEHCSAVLSELYHPPLEIVGIWHKHNQPGEPPFSLDDIALHAELKRLSPFPCCSLLYERTNHNCYDMRMFQIISDDGSTKEITFQIISHPQ